MDGCLRLGIDDEVVAGIAAVEVITSDAPPQDVASVASEQRIAIAAALQQIVAALPVERICSTTAGQDVVSIAAIQTVLVCTAPDRVGSGTAFHSIVAVLPVNDIVPPLAKQMIVAGEAVDAVMARRTDHRVVEVDRVGFGAIVAPHRHAMTVKLDVDAHDLVRTQLDDGTIHQILFVQDPVFRDTVRDKRVALVDFLGRRIVDGRQDFGPDMGHRTEIGVQVLRYLDRLFAA